MSFNPNVELHKRVCFSEIVSEYMYPSEHDYGSDEDIDADQTYTRMQSLSTESGKNKKPIRKRDRAVFGKKTLSTRDIDVGKSCTVCPIA